MTQDQPDHVDDLVAKAAPFTPSERVAIVGNMLDRLLEAEARTVSGPPGSGRVYDVKFLTEALERLAGLEARQPQPRPVDEDLVTIPTSVIDDLHAVLVAAVGLLEAIDSAELERDHFTGVLDVIPPRLERLEAAVDAVPLTDWRLGR